MGKYYKPPPLTGKEYVLATDKFVSVTTFRCERLPKAWKDYTLNPIVSDAVEIRRLVHIANKVYLNPDNLSKEELLHALNDRISYLEQALRRFEAYDTEFDNLMVKVDLTGYEAKRLKELILTIIAEQNRERGEDPIQITCNLGVNNLQYETTLGTKTKKLMLTHKNVEHWIAVRREAEKLIKEKLTKDRAYRKNLQGALSG